MCSKSIRHVLGCALILGALVANANGAPAAHAATEPQGRFCYTWSLRNFTGDDANDLHVRLRGIKAINAAYDETDNPFGQPISTSAYIAATDVYSLSFAGSTAADADQIRVGVCSDANTLRLAEPAADAIYWTKDGTRVAPTPDFLGVMWQWSSPKNLQVQLFNDTPMTMTVTSLWMYDALGELAVNELAPDATTGMQPVVNLSEDVLAIAPNSAQKIDVTFGVADPGANSPEAVSTGYVPLPNQPFVVQVAFAPEDDLSAESSLVVQGFSPLGVYLPVVLK
jgi:hypothetical protein